MELIKESGNGFQFNEVIEQDPEVEFKSTSELIENILGDYQLTAVYPGDTEVDVSEAAEESRWLKVVATVIAIPLTLMVLALLFKFWYVFLGIAMLIGIIAHVYRNKDGIEYLPSTLLVTSEFLFLIDGVLYRKKESSYGYEKVYKLHRESSTFDKKIVGDYRMIIKSRFSSNESISIKFSKDGMHNVNKKHFTLKVISLKELRGMLLK